MSTGGSETSSPMFCVGLKEVPMHPDSEFHNWLAAQNESIQPRHSPIQHLELVVFNHA